MYSSMQTSGTGTGGVVDPDAVNVTATARDFDVLVYGIGYTGKLVCEQLIKRAKESHLNLRLAISARNAEKLETYRAYLDTLVEGSSDVTLHSEPISLSGGAPVEESGLLEGEASNKPLFDLMARSQVCVNTAGPYRDACGEVVVRTCIRAGTHYVDTNGEPDFTSLMARKYWDEAKAQKVMLIYSAGFDSAPGDAWGICTCLIDMACFKIQEEHSEDPVQSISAFVNMQGKPSLTHGTTRTLVEAMVWAVPHMSCSLLMCQGGATLEYPEGEVEKSIPSSAPKLSSVAKKSPLTGNPVKLRMVPDANNVMWSWKLKHQGQTDGFEYAQYVDLKGEQVEDQFGCCFKCCLGTFMFGGCLKCACCRSCLLSLHGEENCGPEEDDAKNTHVDFGFQLKTASGKVELIEASCDEMYLFTAQSVAEAALCLRYDKLPMEGGHATPAAGLGAPYLERLIDGKFLRFKM